MLPRSVAFWLVAAAAAMVLAASSVPSPLYSVYQREFGFSALTLTLIFAVYVFALMASLLTVGRLSDYVGRRVVLAGALIIEAGAMALFLGAEGVGRIVEVGPGVDTVAVGDLVVLPLLAGAWRERLLLRAEGLFALPDGNIEQLSMLGGNPPTAGLILSEYASLEPGDCLVPLALALRAQWLLRERPRRVVGLMPLP